MSGIYEHLKFSSSQVKGSKISDINLNNIFTINLDNIFKVLRILSFPCSVLSISVSYYYIVNCVKQAGFFYST